MNKPRRLDLWLSLFAALVMSAAASAGGKQSAPIRLFFALCSVGAAAFGIEQVARLSQQEDSEYLQRRIELERQQVYAQADLEADRTVAHFRAADRLMAENPELVDFFAPPIDVPSTPVEPSQDAPEIDEEGGTVALLSQPLPDGATLVPIAALENINRYPVVMVIAGQGSGKSVTIAAIFEQLSGLKALSTPKAADHLNPAIASVYDVRFGFNATTGEGANFGNIEDTSFEDSLDLSWYLQNQRVGGSVLQFSWAMERESQNRMRRQLEHDAPSWRIFFDEAAQSYLNGFADPFDPKRTKEKRAQHLISTCNKDAFLNFRGQRLQTFFGSQVETVESIGLSNFAAARDEAWYLYPGLAAIAAAKAANKQALADWLQRRVDTGYAIALLEKQGAFFECLDLPRLSDLKRFDPQPASAPQLSSAIATLPQELQAIAAYLEKKQSISIRDLKKGYGRNNNLTAEAVENLLFQLQEWELIIVKDNTIHWA